MELLGDVGLVKSYFGLFGYGVSVSSRWVHSLRQTYNRHNNCFRRTSWYSKVTRLNRKLVLVRLEIVLILTQDRCTICAERTKA
jgi:hypothetical protein